MPGARIISRGRSIATPAPTSQLKPWQRRHPLLGRDQPVAAAPEIGGDPLAGSGWRDSAAATEAPAPTTVNGLRSNSYPTRSSPSPSPDIAGDEQHRDVGPPRRDDPDQFGPGHFGHDDVADDEVEGLAVEQPRSPRHRSSRRSARSRGPRAPRRWRCAPADRPRPAGCARRARSAPASRPLALRAGAGRARCALVRGR